MPARSPEQIDVLFADALNAGNVDALTKLYEPDASLRPSPDRTVSGLAAIREALSQFVAAKPSMTLSARTVAQSGDIALVTAQWQLAMTGPDGKPAQVSGQSVEVVRRQANGDWLFVIDEPFGIVAK